MTRWAILTGEYPPQPGGVSDYTRLVATGLSAAGDEVTVFAPRYDICQGAEVSGPTIVRLPDHFGARGLLALDRALAQARPDRVLIQYVPHAYGCKGMNLPFAVWVAARASRFAPLVVMVHELNVPFRWRPTNAVLSAAHMVMARLLAGSAEQVFVSIPSWGERLRRFCPRTKPAEWLPIPSNFEDTCAQGNDGRSAGEVLIGHFGTYGPGTVGLLEPALFRLLAPRKERRAVLLGRGGAEFRDWIVARHPDLSGQLLAPGELPPQELIVRLMACDLLLQPFNDGVSSRRTSMMAGLALGRAIVTNLGELSEPLWGTVGCLGLAPSPDSDALTAAAEAVLGLAKNTLAGLRRAAFPSSL
jgi:Glycosyl transferase 4-like domain